jgi:hypothetical protein
VWNERAATAFIICFVTFCGFIDKLVQHFAMPEIRCEQYVALSHTTNAASVVIC